MLNSLQWHSLLDLLLILEFTHGLYYIIILEKTLLNIQEFLKLTKYKLILNTLNKIIVRKWEDMKL